jgi:hypothetical protein
MSALLPKADIARCFPVAAANVDPQMPLERFSRQIARGYDGNSSPLLGPRSEASKSSRFRREIGPYRPTATCSRSIKRNVAVLAV